MYTEAPRAKNSIENDGKGPFEKELFESPNFTSLHSMSFSFLVWHTQELTETQRMHPAQVSSSQAKTLPT
jgi:hypothetical protein